jgi:hypothetical protein
MVISDNNIPVDVIIAFITNGPSIKNPEIKA